MIVCKGKTLKEYLPKIKNNNKQGEYYLTDLSGMLTSADKAVGILVAPDLKSYPV